MQFGDPIASYFGRVWIEKIAIARQSSSRCDTYIHTASFFAASKFFGRGARPRPGEKRFRVTDEPSQIVQGGTRQLVASMHVLRAPASSVVRAGTQNGPGTTTECALRIYVRSCLFCFSLVHVEATSVGIKDRNKIVVSSIALSTSVFR